MWETPYARVAKRHSFQTINEHMLRFTPNLEWLDLSHNQLTLAQSSSFFAAQRLARLDLGHNRIQRFYYDSFAPLFQVCFERAAYAELNLKFRKLKTGSRKAEFLDIVGMYPSQVEATMIFDKKIKSENQRKL